MKVLRLKSRAKIHSLAFAPDGALLAHSNHWLRRINLNSGEEIAVLHCDNPPVVVHPGTHRATVSPLYQALPMLRPMTGVWLADLRKPNHTDWVALVRNVPAVYDTAFSPSGEVVAAAYLEADSRQGQVQVWKSSDATVIRTLTFPRPVRALAIGSDGAWLAVAVGYWNQAEVRVYRLDEVNLAATFAPKRGRVQKIRAVGDASSFVGLAGSRLFVVRPGEPTLVTDPVDNRGGLKDVAVSPNGNLITTVSADRRVRTWQTATAALVLERDWKIGSLTAVCFSPDGLTCAAGGENGQIVVWDVDV